MKKNITEAVWTGPDGSIQDKYRRYFKELCFHPVLLKKYSKRTLSNLQKRLERAIDYLLYLYKMYDLLSPYHSCSHNIVTCVTSYKVFIGKIMLENGCSLKDLQTLLFAALFHDTGYLQISELQKNTRARFMHVEISSQITKRFLSLELLWNDKRIYDVIETQHLTEYRYAETALKDIRKNPCGALIIGADIMQVTDANYDKNLILLTELLFTRNRQRNIQNQKEFYVFTKKATRFVWKYLDAFYGGFEKNPYRKGWERFETFMKKQLQD